MYALSVESRRSLPFRNGRLQLYVQDRDAAYLTSLRVWLAATSLWTACLSHSLLRGKVIRTILFGSLFCLFSRNLYQVASAFKKVIRRMDLHEDGRSVDIVFADGTKIEVQV